MWAQDVAAMLGYHMGATSVASTLAPFSSPPTSLAGLPSSLGGLWSQITAAAAKLPTTLAGLEAAVSAAPLQQLTSVAQIGMYPASMMMSPMMSLAQGANGGSAGLAGSAGAGLVSADMPKFVGSTVPDIKGMGGVGGVGGLGSGMSAGLGQARLVGAMSVPPTWQGSMPSRMISSAMAGLGPGGVPAAEMAPAGGGTGGMGMMPMPMGGGMGAGGMPGGMMGRGGASPHVVQNRPSVIPRTGVG
jgi:PPE-repeat protein